MKETTRLALVSAIAPRALAAMFGTLRFLTHNAPSRDLRIDGRPTISVCWHGHLLPFAYYHRGQGVGTMISRSRDGEYIARVAEAWGFRVVRGSSSRGGDSALRGALRVIRDDRSFAITPDGPRGPYRKVKAGALHLARATGLPVLPTALGASAVWAFRSWDTFLVPRPFARVHLEYGTPVHVARDADDTEVQRLMDLVESQLNDLSATAARRSA